MKAWTDRLTPENCNIIYSSKDFENTATDSIKHFDISYSIAPIAEDLVERFNTAMTTTTTTTYGKEAVFHLPERNPYVPDPQHLLAYKTPLTDKGSTSFRAPSEVYSSPQTVFYHKQDRAFGAPYVYMSLNLFPQERESVAAQDAAVRIIVGSLMNDAFLTWTYLGKVANVTSNVGFGADGVLEIGVKSYNDNFQPFAKRLLGEVRAYKPDPARFAVVKEKCALRLESELMTKSGTTIAKDLFSQCVTRSAVPSAEVLASLRGLTCDAVTAWLAGFWAAGVKVAAYVYGAISEAEAKEFAADAEHIVDTPVPAKIVQNIVASIPAGCDRVIDAEVPNEKETNSCVYDVFEVGRGVTCPDELSQALCANLLVAVVKAAAFKVLRTKEQLGYLVWTMSSTVLGVKYIKFVVMSASHTPRHVDSRIEAFIESYRSILEDIPLEEFEERKKGLVSDIADSKRDMQDEFSSLSWEFFNGTFLWQRSAVASKLVMALTKEDVLRMYDTALLNKSTRRKLSVQLHSRVHKDQDIPLCDIRDPACHFNSFAKEWNNFQPMPDPFSPDKACKDFSFDN